MIDNTYFYISGDHNIRGHLGRYTIEDYGTVKVMGSGGVALGLMK